MPQFQLNNKNFHIGVAAENLAVTYLEQLGYNVLHQRWKSKFGEIDIVAYTHDTLLFIEVKSRKNLNDFVVSYKQQKRNAMAALDFIGRYSYQFQSHNIRYDCVLISANKIIQYITNYSNIEQ